MRKRNFTEFAENRQLAELMVECDIDVDAVCDYIWAFAEKGILTENTLRNNLNPETFNEIFGFGKKKRDPSNFSFTRQNAHGVDDARANVGGLAQTAGEYMGQGLDAAKVAAVNKANQLKTGATNVLGRAGAGLHNMQAGAEDAVLNTLGSAGNAIRNKWGQLATGAGNLLGQAKTSAGNLLGRAGTAASNVGADIKQGVKNFGNQAALAGQAQKIQMAQSRIEELMARLDDIGINKNAVRRVLMPLMQFVDEKRNAILNQRDKARIDPTQAQHATFDPKTFNPSTYQNQEYVPWETERKTWTDRQAPAPMERTPIQPQAQASQGRWQEPLPYNLSRGRQRIKKGFPRPMP